ncbi:MAG: 5-(carboxyamino)imidazole ribonucleotide synthase [Bacteroidetes bacterium CG12_big_fil_rev_8_21_14_0_65_60_17]|nr:MAG: 5-(carboxyamino)imidazole ribonucleotide synthase [Bacteroidetes bacterium CG12_big_fil_rev_8_21_14_0_65_60_17]
MSSSFPTIGILGGGQLGRMSAMAALRIGFGVRTLSPVSSPSVEGIGQAHVGDWTDRSVLDRFVSRCDVITVESEWAPAERAEEVAAERIPMYPTGQTLHTIRHKGRQKNALHRAGIPVSDYACCSMLEDAKRAVSAFGFPVLFKKFEGSYDGYGNATIRTPGDMKPAWDKLAAEDGLLVEAFVPFRRELAIIVVRSPSGVHVTYPVVHTIQRDHRCHAVLAPAPLPATVTTRVEELARRAADTVGAVGLLGVELFEHEDGSILINELAPRPHNTGHYTIEACHTSQFENHVRSVAGWPLGDASLRVPAAAMVNILGTRTGKAETKGMREAMAVCGASIHIYGKQEVRPRRKMGHVTVTAATTEEALARAEEAAGYIHL